MTTTDEKTTVTPVATIVELDRAQLDAQIQTAKWYPRSLTEFKRRLLEHATLDEETAGSMFYALPRAGKTIEGPSVHMARAAAAAFQNLRIRVEMGEESDRFVTAIGMAVDLENNVGVQLEEKRRITDRNGVRFNDDMIGMTFRACRAIAYREAVFSVIPRSFIKQAYEAAKRASLGEGTLSDRRKRAFAWFAEHARAPESDVLELLGRAGMEDVSLNDLVRLTGLRTMIVDEETTFQKQLARVREERKVAEGVAVSDDDLDGLKPSEVEGEDDAKR